jgi:hypothetical protein
MAYDPHGTGAGPDDLLVRRGQSWESAHRLAGQAVKAELVGVAQNNVPFGHGVSVSSPEANQIHARDPTDACQATRRAFEEAGFEVRYTPTKWDSDHHTIVLPKPVTQAVAVAFNTVLGRTRKRP